MQGNPRIISERLVRGEGGKLPEDKKRATQGELRLFADAASCEPVGQ